MRLARESSQKMYSVSPINPPCGFLTIFSKRLGIFNQFLYTYHTFLSTLGDNGYSIISKFYEVMPY